VLGLRICVSLFTLWSLMTYSLEVLRCASIK
jgi:hypothetical protein